MDTPRRFVDYLLAIDIGNTHIKVGLYHHGQWQEEWRLSTDPKRTADEYRIPLKSFLQDVLVEQVDQVVMASVVPLLTPVFHRVARTLSDAPPLDVTPPGYGLKVQYTPPDSLGADRFVNALGAWRKYRMNLVVVDVGTTATVDAVSHDGVFLGGTIAPGPHFLAQALAQGTARLPLIPPAIPDKLLGQNTQEAIAIGVGHGFIGMVNELIIRTWQVLGEKAPVILTGGWANRIMSHLPCEAKYEPMLTLDGLRYAAEYHFQRS
ncbi:type III pantothenate kinase [Sulfobacillus thermosulfidooxidans DSM 9293]|uniref:Type III pantothenate kinase n=1 Tax=Sulfobacillus thermosulfidooxidans (strain DSM 9293 / VKM B-1269 / AT-1) TaxID=929705 RepID=A0A1W1WA44_SULTA|nr:type III pantothenate kinase [Sulfobacillus thermosulfidooxidans]SMC03082.1 type III pantothenate kinase [Sulfobacillus thermosulfidooxidans DSM 9293]